MCQIEKRHLFGGGTMETKWVIYDSDARRTLGTYYDTKRQAEKALTRLLSKQSTDDMGGQQP